MPELPEVETIVRTLREKLPHLEFSGMEVALGKCICGSPKSMVASLRGRKILSVERRGKYIIFRLSGRMALLAHLRMTGKFRIVPAHTDAEKHTHVIFSFKNHPDQLRFMDQRQFGRFYLEEEEKAGLKSLAKLGPEPLEISLQAFVQLVRKRKGAMKPLLLNQQFLAGVGNIYADEALHRAHIHPRRQVDTLAEEELLGLHRVLQQTLREAIRWGGSSVRTYVDASGATGRFQNFLRVYGKEGEACGTCGTSILRERVGGRSSFFCPSCQPERRQTGSPLTRAGSKKWSRLQRKK